MYACSLRVSGCFSPVHSILRVLGNEELACFYPAIATTVCPCADGEEMCVQSCPHEALLFVADADIPAHLRRASGFVAAPVVDPREPTMPAPEPRE